MRLTSALLLLALFVSFSPSSPGKLFVPPGTVQVNDSLYFDQTETSNLSWLEYMWWEEREHGINSPEYISTLPDTQCWRDELAYNEPYVEYYLRHPAYSSHPAVGISFEQAAGYCKWRTGVVRKGMDAGQYEKKILPKSFVYRLPTRAEWEEAAKAGFSERTQKNIVGYKWKDYWLYNAIQRDSTNEDSMHHAPEGLNSEADITAPVDFYFPNKLGIYNLFGNVAEIISEKGIAKGGGWNDEFSELKAENDFPYEKPASWLGFRCVCEVRWN